MECGFISPTPTLIPWQIIWHVPGESCVTAWRWQKQDSGYQTGIKACGLFISLLFSCYMSLFSHHLCLVSLFLSSSVPSFCRPWWRLLYSSGVQTGEMFISSCWLECKQNCCDLLKEQAEGCALHQCCHVLVGDQAWSERRCCRPALFGRCHRRGRSLKGKDRSHLCKHNTACS